MTRTGAAICNRIKGVYDALERLHEPILIERLAGIESELHRLGEIARGGPESWLPSSGGRSNGRG